MSKEFKGIRIRVEGERARHAVAAVTDQGLKVIEQHRLSNDTGYQIRTAEGPVINLYDTGTITVTGSRGYLVRDREALRYSRQVCDVLIVAVHDNDCLMQLGLKLQSMGVSMDAAFFSNTSWMKKVSAARKTGKHVVALVSCNSDTESSTLASEVYFGIGLLVARIPFEHLTVIHDDTIDFPYAGGLMSRVLISYHRNIETAISCLPNSLQKPSAAAA